MSGPKRKVYVTMVADLFHYGHVEFLKHARGYGDYLVVGLLSDKRAAIQKRTPILTGAERMRIVEACRYVDEVHLHDVPLTNKWLKDNGYVARVLAVGNESDRQRRRIRKDHFESKYFIEVPYEPGISTTEIIQRIKLREDL